jgi:hypothetical protein
MSPAVSTILIECPDARLILADDAERFIMLTLHEAAACAKKMSDTGYRPAGVIATLLDGSIGAASEPGCGELVGRALAAFLRERAECKPEQSGGDALAWLETLWSLADPR